MTRRGKTSNAKKRGERHCSFNRGQEPSLKRIYQERGAAELQRNGMTIVNKRGIGDNVYPLGRGCNNQGEVRVSSSDRKDWMNRRTFYCIKGGGEKMLSRRKGRPKCYPYTYSGRSRGVF